LKCRSGIPDALRCSIWITSIVQATQPHQTERVIQEYGTLRKVSALDYAWEMLLKEMFPDASDEEDSFLIDFGLGKDLLNNQLLGGIDDGTNTPIPDKHDAEFGVRKLKRVLNAIQHVLNVEYCPLLPHITCIFLEFMSDSFAYASLREMINESSRFLPITEEQYYAWCKTFHDMMTRMHPQTAKEMETCGVLLSPYYHGLDPIFKRFFSPILKHEHVLRIMDIYTIEGCKVLFRFGISLIALYKKQLKTMNINSAALWWAEVRTFTHSDSFDFDMLLKKAYGFHGSRVRKRVYFPRRRTINRMIKMNELWIDKKVENDDMEILSNSYMPPPKPLGIHYQKEEQEHDEQQQKQDAGYTITEKYHDENEDHEHKKETPKIILAKPAFIRSHLASWVPFSLRTCKLDLIYSTTTDGRSLELFYPKVQKTKRTITLIEVLSPDSSNEKNFVIGMYASQAWHRSTHIYGDGECFLFSLNNNNNDEPKCYRWRPRSAGSIDDEKNATLMEQFMLSTDKFIAMGGVAGPKGDSCGLRLNEDFTRGESDTALGFDNEPLAGKNRTTFEVGLVEVYRFVRAVDGKGIDGEDDDIWNL